jgi:predicted DNA-binding ribbon-helix-helix protein
MGPLIFLGKSMCDIYTSADPIHYEQRTRSMRIRGVVTSIRLENLCWDILARIASKDQMTTNQLISKLYDEIIERQGRVDNLSSFLRVSCMRYLSYVAEQQEKDHLMMKQSVLTNAGQVHAMPTRLQLKSS